MFVLAYRCVLLITTDYAVISTRCGDINNYMVFHVAYEEGSAFLFLATDAFISVITQ